MSHSEYRREIPDSRCAVLFIHGIQGSPCQFEPFYASVPENWSIVNLLLEGHGGEVRDFSRASMDGWKAQVAAAADELAAKHSTVIIVGHSMGTFFAMDTARRLPGQVKGLLLVAVPLVITVTPRAGFNSLRVILTSPPDKSPVVAAARAAYSIRQDRCLWRYLGWIPRYLELFAEAARQRRLIPELKTHCHVCQSAKDELVSRRSEKYISKNPDIVLDSLASSGHFFFAEEDLSFMQCALSAMCGKFE